MRDDAEERVLVLAPTGRDGALACAALNRQGIRSEPFRDMQALCAACEEGAGALLVAEEAVDPAGFARLAAHLDAQEPWSDLPIVLLAAPSSEGPVARAGSFLERLRNIMVLERPVRIPVLVTAIQVALRARKRQYELRQYVRLRDEVARERARMLASEQQARREAETANRMKDEFLATVSHELRTPVNVILGWSGMLRDGYDDDSVRARAIQVFHRNAQAQAHVIDELLDVSRIITGKLRMHVAPVQVIPLVQDVIESLRPAIEGKRLHLETHLPAEPLRIWADADRVRQVLWTLLSNAVKFTPEGGRLSIAAARTAGQVEIRVADTGIGIRRDVLPFIFDRFRQGDSTSTRAHGGLGLGLAIVRQLVELHGGNVEAFSGGERRGSEFVVRLPVRGVTDVPDGRRADGTRDDDVRPREGGFDP